MVAKDIIIKLRRNPIVKVGRILNRNTSIIYFSVDWIASYCAAENDLINFSYSINFLRHWNTERNDIITKITTATCEYIQFAESTLIYMKCEMACWRLRQNANENLYLRALARKYKFSFASKAFEKALQTLPFVCYEVATYKWLRFQTLSWSNGF